MSQTPSQTVGPFFAYSLTAKQYGYNYDSIITGSLVDDTIEGERIYIRGHIIDGQGNTIGDAVIELIQTDEQSYTHHSSLITARAAPSNSKIARLGTGTTPDHSFTFTTIKPKPNNGQAPHINVIVMMRGSLHHLYTRLYFDDEDEANQQDSLLNAIPEARRNTLIAHRKEVNHQFFYEFNIRMQQGEHLGEDETVFFQV
jgi:protocatechuate 3,4-dioxygenase, alpha subunit